MHTQAPYIGRADKGAKVPQYRQAFRAFVERPVAPTPSDLAAEFNLHPMGICNAMERQGWFPARMMYQANLNAVSGLHLDQLAHQVQDRILSGVQDAYNRIVPLLLESLRAIENMPVEPPASGSKRGKSTLTLNRGRLELVRTIAKTLEEIGRNAERLGLVVPVLDQNPKRLPPLGSARAAIIDAQLQAALGAGSPPAEDEEMAFEVETPDQGPQDGKSTG